MLNVLKLMDDMRMPVLGRPLAWLIVAILLSGCGYRFGQGVLSERYSTITVPFVEGDRDGDLTAAIVKQISISGAFAYEQCGGDLTLIVKVIDYDEENIGFRYDRKKNNRIKNALVPTETRTEIIVEVTLIDSIGGCTLRGPTIIKTSVDFDHDYYLSPNEINVFSLGQVTDIEEARDAVLRPLHVKIARRIVDYITNSW